MSLNFCVGILKFVFLLLTSGLFVRGTEKNMDYRTDLKSVETWVMPWSSVNFFFILKID